MAKPKKRWVYNPPKPAKPKVPESVKQEVQVQANTLIETVLKPLHVKAPPDHPDLNYIIDIYAKWYRNYFYFCATYACPGPHALSPTFDTKFARMEYLANGQYRLSYMRHTEQWWEFKFDVSMEKAFEQIGEGGYFHP